MSKLNTVLKSSSHPTSKLLSFSAISIGLIGLLILVFAGFGWISSNPVLLFFFGHDECRCHSLFCFLYKYVPAGIKNNHNMSSSISSKGILAWLTAMVLTAFYILLYWYPEYLGLHANGNFGLIGFFDPLSRF